jgi:FMN-dependent NADH-azoreductase
MTTLLRIDVSARAQGSYSRRVADRLEAAWRAAHPGGRVVGRDLAAAPPPHLDGAALDGGRAVALIDELITELRGAIPGGACSDDFQLPYLRAALGFLGWQRVSIVEIAGTRTPEAAARLAAALTEADAVGGAP